jgi:hypothetical protein
MPNNKTFTMSSIGYEISVLFMGLLEYQPSNTRTCWMWDIIHWPLSVSHFPRLPIWIYLLTAWNPLLQNPRRIRTSTKSKECIKTKCKNTDPNKEKKKPGHVATWYDALGSQNWVNFGSERWQPQLNQLRHCTPPIHKASRLTLLTSSHCRNWDKFSGEERRGDCRDLKNPSLDINTIATNWLAQNSWLMFTQMYIAHLQKMVVNPARLWIHQARSASSEKKQKRRRFFKP